VVSSVDFWPSARRSFEGRRDTKSRWPEELYEKPSFAAEKFDRASGELDFAFAGGSNISPGAGPMHDAVLHLASNDHFDAKWDFVEAGRVKFSEEIHYTRTK
jgi:hypothetical protein